MTPDARPCPNCGEGIRDRGALQDASARLTRALEALHDGDQWYAVRVLEDLRDELLEERAA